MSDATPGRNEPCPCGSGRKYKQCCLAAAARDAEAPHELAWQRHRRALEGFSPQMLRFIFTAYGPQAIDEAWSEFLLFPDEPVEFDRNTPHMQLFMPWFFHLWAPDPHDTTVEDDTLHDCPPTRAWLERQGARVDLTLRRYLECCIATPLSFHEITTVTPGHGFRARDVLTGEVRDVNERGASKTLEIGDLLFAQLVSVDGLTILEACPPMGLPPIEKVAVIELRSKLHASGQPIDAAVLHDWDLELRELYLDATDRILAPPPPRLHNTDGDPIEPHRLIFDLDPGADAVTAAFEALRHLAAEEDAADALASAGHGATGAFTTLRFDWIRRGRSRSVPLQYTVLGQVEIRPGRLVCEVNSAKRAAAFRRLVRKALPSTARFRVAEIMSLESIMAEASLRDAPRTAPGPGPGLEPPTAIPPELQAELSRYIAQYYERWLHEKIPALRGRTPLAAVRDPDGREQVEALVRDIERDGPRMNPPLDPGVTRRLRERLGLGEA